MFDLLIRDGAIVEGNELRARGIAVADGKVAALLDPRDAPPARQTLAFPGCIVLPGLIDAHVHFRDPGLTHKEDFESGSRAAALGGVTTVMVMPTDKPMTQTPGQFAEKRALAEGRAHVDFALQALLGRDLSHVRALLDAGAASFEIFLGLIEEKVDDSAMLVAALAAVREAGGVAGVTPYDEGLAKRAPSLPPEVEASGIARALCAQRLSGGRMHIRQMSSRLGLAALALAGEGVTSEVTPHNLLLTRATFERLGAVAKVVPPLRSEDDTRAMREALAAGRISIVATDHAPHTPQEKDAGVEKAPGGFPGVQTLLPLLLKLVGDKAISYADLVRCACEQPARIFGLYPQKGTLAPGSDADLVVVDTGRPMRIRNADQASKAARTPFDGWEIPASPRLTLLRGEPVAADGKLAGPPRGRFVRPSGSRLH